MANSEKNTSKNRFKIYIIHTNRKKLNNKDLKKFKRRDGRDTVA